MSFNLDWDIEKYKTKFECEEHWALKRDFMLAHKDRFPEERLICLAQLFVNIELLRCKYPDKVMEQVSVLAKEIGHDYKESQKKKLQRTFVKASDAASAKARGDKRSYTQLVKTDSSCEKNLKTGNLLSNINFTSLPDASSKISDSSINKYIHLARKNVKSDEVEKKVSPRIQSIRAKITAPESCTPQTTSETIESLLDNKNPLTKIVVLINQHMMKLNNFSFVNLLTTSLSFSKMSLIDKYSFSTNKTTCYLQTDSNQLLGSGFGSSKKEAKEEAAKNALAKLLKVCFSMKIKKYASGDGEVSLDQLGVKDPDTEPEKLSESNVGAKLMKMMGWSGGALGKTGQGITEPIKEATVIGRSGLGLGPEEGITPQFIGKIRSIIHKYMNTEGVKDLIFSSDLSNIQRKAIHEQVLRISKKQLKTVSHGKGNERHLVMSWKMNNVNALQTVLDEGGATDKYELFKPNTLTIQGLLDMTK